MICSEKSNHVIIDGCISRQKTRRTARQVVYIIIHLLVVSPFSGHRLVVDRQKKARESVLFSLIFACGEYNCFAVIFRCRRVKLRCAQFGRRISFHFSRQRNSSRLPQDKHFIPRVSGIIHSIPQELGFIFLLVMGCQARILFFFQYPSFLSTSWIGGRPFSTRVRFRIAVSITRV